MIKAKPKPGDVILLDGSMCLVFQDGVRLRNIVLTRNTMAGHSGSMQDGLLENKEYLFNLLDVLEKVHDEI